MTRYTAVFDGSGSPADTIAVVVAGFVAPDDQWVDFERNWNDCLKHFGVSALHMRHFAHSRGEFTGWKQDEAKRRSFLRQLIGIIKARVWHSFASAVLMDDYRKVDAKYCLSEFSRPYALAGCTCLAKLNRWGQKWLKPEDGIAIVFEDGDNDKGALVAAVKQHFTITPAFLSKEKSVAFQAADLLAYENLLANKKVKEKGIVFENELRYPLAELSKLPGGHDSDDWGVHMEDDMMDSCSRDSIALRNPDAGRTVGALLQK
jgi:hypothetical protein